MLHINTEPIFGIQAACTYTMYNFSNPFLRSPSVTNLSQRTSGSPLSTNLRTINSRFNHRKQKKTYRRWRLCPKVNIKRDRNTTVFHWWGRIPRIVARIRRLLSSDRCGSPHWQYYQGRQLETSRNMTFSQRMFRYSPRSIRWSVIQWSLHIVITFVRR